METLTFKLKLNEIVVPLIRRAFEGMGLAVLRSANVKMVRNLSSNNPFKIRFLVYQIFPCSNLEKCLIKITPPLILVARRVLRPKVWSLQLSSWLERSSL